MAKSYLIKFLFAFFMIGNILAKTSDKKRVSPPHCTHVSKDTDYTGLYKLQYPVAYIIPGQREVYQQMFCLNPAEVNKAVTTVCDWTAPPQVQFTLGDEYMHVVRVDPTGRYNGNAVITTYQLCGHNRTAYLDAESKRQPVTVASSQLQSVKDLNTV